MKLILPKAAQLSAAAQKAKAKPKRDLLFGTGITKDVAKKADKQHAIAEETVKSVAQRICKGCKEPIVDKDWPHSYCQDCDEQGNGGPDEFQVGVLPSTLMASDLVLDEYQTAALNGLRDQKYGCLIGAAGTGKTTTLKALIAEVENSVPVVDMNFAKVEVERNANKDMHVAVCFCSFMGRAVQQMKRALPEKYHGLANTIHRTLGYRPTTEERMDKETNEMREVRVFRPSFTEFNKLPFKICIVDEAGTVPINLWNELIAALPSDCRIFLIGDLNQLPPVQGRSVLGFAMLAWPTFALEHLHRQAEGDPIAENAHRVLQGKKPLSDETTKKFIVKKIGDGSLGARKETLMVIQHLHKQGIFDPLRDALIVPQNISAVGQVELNQQLVNYFNPVSRDVNGEIQNPRIIITAGYMHTVFAAGDKVMLLANDNNRGLTNGMIGIVESIVPNGNFRGEAIGNNIKLKQDDADFDLTDLADELLQYAKDDKDAEDESERAASHIMTVKFQNRDEDVLFETAGAFKKVAHAYAFTCHKAQGGEYPNVVILAHSCNLRMLTREWLYTAITRAQERVILLCNQRGLTHAVNSQKIKGKTIAEKAEQFLKLQDQTDTQMPILPPPEEIRYAKINAL